MKFARYRLFKYIYTPIKRSVRKKLMTIMLLIGVVPLIIATMISYQNSKQAMEKEVLGQNSAKIKWVSDEIYDNLERINEALTAFYYDNDVQFYLSKIGEEDRLQKLGSTYFRDKLMSYVLANYRDFEKVSFYVVDEKIAYHHSIEYGSETENLPDDFMTENKVLNLNDRLFVYSDVAMDSSSEVQSVDGPYLIKYNRRFDDQKIMSILVVKIKWDIFDKAVALLKIEKGSQAFYIDKTGKVIEGLERSTSSNSDKSTLLHYLEEFKGESNYFLVDDRYVFFEQMTENLYIVKVIPQSIVSESYLKTLNSQMIIIIVTGLLIIIITILTGMRITKPIIMLAKSMQNIEDHINGSMKEEILVVKSNDEIKILEQSYKMMIQKIKELIDQEYKQKIELQSAHLMALQAQINPHFMYNTLQMIGAMAIAKNSPEIYQIITAFSKMMRYNMRLTEEMVTIEEEVQNVVNYLKIQQMRFNNQLGINYMVAEQTKDFVISKLSLQPIVENCFKHGFLNNSRDWEILVEIQEQDDAIEIGIKDNGYGISDERIKEISEFLALENNTISKSMDSLGLKNIDTRIKLYFGTQYGLRIEANEDFGTKVTMRIGKTLKEHTHD
ncbi:MAG: histidine kinase [Vallitaleaceae bacterium]|nr:histidine kinase [Vallitaleaceae bacterium]